MRDLEKPIGVRWTQGRKNRRRVLSRLGMSSNGPGPARSRPKGSFPPTFHLQSITGASSLEDADMGYRYRTGF